MLANAARTKNTKLALQWLRGLRLLEARPLPVAPMDFSMSNANFDACALSLIAKSISFPIHKHWGAATTALALPHAFGF